MSDGKIQKRVVLKVWQRDGIVCDNAAEIEWLERAGWEVTCTEKLLACATTGVSHVLYVLKWANANEPPLLPNPPSPLELRDVNVPDPEGRIILACSATRGRIIVREFDSRTDAFAATVGPGTGTHESATAANFVVMYLRHQQVPAAYVPLFAGIYCINDANPFSPAPAPAYQEAPDGVFRVDAYFTGSNVVGGAKPVALVDSIALPAGRARVFPVRFVPPPQS